VTIRVYRAPLERDARVLAKSTLPSRRDHPSRKHCHREYVKRFCLRGGFFCWARDRLRLPVDFVGAGEEAVGGLMLYAAQQIGRSFHTPQRQARLLMKTRPPKLPPRRIPVHVSIRRRGFSVYLFCVPRPVCLIFKLLVRQKIFRMIWTLAAQRLARSESEKQRYFFYSVRRSLVF